MSEMRFLCRVLRVQKHKDTSFLFVAGCRQTKQLAIKTAMLDEYDIAVLSIIDCVCEKAINKSEKEIYVITCIKSHVKTNSHGIDINHYTNLMLNYRRCRNDILQEISEFLKVNGFQNINSPFTMKYRGTSTAKPLLINSKHVKRYCKITHELELKKACSELLLPVYEIGYVANDIYTTKAKWFEYSVLEFVSPFHDESFIADFILNVIEIATRIADSYGIEHEDFKSVEIVKLDENNLENSYEQNKKDLRNVLFLNAPTKSPLVKTESGSKTETIWYFNDVSMAHGYVDENNYKIFKDVCNEQKKQLAQKGIDSELSADFVKLLKIGIPESVSLGMGVDRFFQMFFSFDSLKTYIESCLGYYE